MGNLYPSTAHLWSNCAAQPRLSREAPKQPPSEAALEGTCATWLAEIVLTGQVATCDEMIGQSHKNGWEIDQAMAHYIQNYVDHVRSLVEPGGELFVEHRLVFNEHVQGDADVAILNAAKTHGIIIDLKYGFKIVEPWDAQPIIYGRSLLQKYNLQGVTTAIYQPRAFHPRGVYRDWTPKQADLVHLAQKYHHASYEATATHPQAIPGEHCKHCPVNDRCGAMTREIYEIFTMMGGRAARPLKPEELSIELEFAKRAEDMIVAHRKSIEAEAIQRLQTGDHIPGWTQEPGWGNRRWKFPREIIMTMTGGFDPAGDAMITPAEAERRGIHPDVVNALTETPRTKARLKRITAEDFKRKFES